MDKFDFSGYATKNDLRCSDGRTIKQDAFKHNDGDVVPLVWQHSHNTPENILGHALLENRDDGVYAYGKFNETPAGMSAKELIAHGDITQLSIYANGLKQRGGDVIHGSIKEVSLVLSGANPGAVIDNVRLAHGDGYIEDLEDEAVIYTGLEIKHADGGERTVGDVFDEMTEEQKNVVYAMLAEVISGGDDGEDIEHSDEDYDYDDEYDEDEFEHSNYEGGNQMKRNVFDGQNQDNQDNESVLSHAEFSAIVEESRKTGQASLRDVFMAHAEQEYGIENIDILFPEARTLTPTPTFIQRENSWVAKVLAGVRKSPFARIKSTAADITADEARARGYIKGNRKKEEVFKLLKRATTPTTIYKKQKLDRDDIIDITDIDVVMWMKGEMRMMLDEEIARAILIGDGRPVDSDDKINEEHIRPIAFEDDLYAPKINVASNISPVDLVDVIMRSKPQYKGTGLATLFTTESVLTDMLLIKDKIGRRLYGTEAELAAALRVKEIIAVEVMETLPNIIGIYVNLNDYVVGADKGGNVNMFDDFDIDFNQYKYLIETRISGALVNPFTALVFQKAKGKTVEPKEPTYNPATGVITIPNTDGVEYFLDGKYDEPVTGSKTLVNQGDSGVIEARAKEGFTILSGVKARWEFVKA